MTLQQKKKLTIRINAHLIEKAKQYAATHNTSVSELVENFLSDLAKTESLSEHTPLVNALTGILPADLDVDSERDAHLREKYGQ